MTYSPNTVVSLSCDRRDRTRTQHRQAHIALGNVHDAPLDVLHDEIVHGRPLGEGMPEVDQGLQEPSQGRLDLPNANVDANTHDETRPDQTKPKNGKRGTDQFRR